MEPNDSNSSTREVLQSGKYGPRKSRTVKNFTVSNPLDAKWIYVYINGDEHFPGLKCVVNSKYYRNFESFLSYLTQRLQPGFGAVRNIYTPIGGHLIESLEELQPNRKYIIAGNEKFRKLEPGCTDNGIKSIRKSEPRPILKRKHVSSRPRPLDPNPVTLYFYKNGVPKTKPVKLVFPTKDLGNLERIFEKLRYRMRCGLIKRIYSLNGKPVNSTNEMQNDQAYVVVEKHDVFKSVSYGIPEINNRCSAKDNEKKPRNLESQVKIHDTGIPNKIIMQIENENDDNSSVKSSAGFNRKYESAIKHRTVDDIRNSNKIDNSKFSCSGDFVRKYQNSGTFEISFQVKELDLDVDLGGVYRAKGAYNLKEGAVEIHDDVETAVEVLANESEDEDELEPGEIEEEEMTPDMERSMQHLSLDPPEELVAYLPSMQGKQQQDANNEITSSDKHNVSQSQPFDIQNIFAS